MNNKKHNPINVTKSFLPPIQEFEAKLKDIWSSGSLTNQGPLLSQLEIKLKEYLELNNGIQLVANGTLALQLAIRGLDLEPGEIITTPFSYVATTSAIMYEGYTPIYVDIDKDSWCIDPAKIEEKITSNTRAILATHVYGNPCDVKLIKAIADNHGLKVIYDAAHAFGATYEDKSLLSYGDVSTCSFHATKVFHTIEGGCVITQDDDVYNKVELLKHFGHHGDTHYMLGINAKMTEFNAAMGLVNLNYIDELLIQRKQIAEIYDYHLGDNIQKPVFRDGSLSNHSYYPVALSDINARERITEALNKKDIYPRRYFYPSLNKLGYLKVASRTDCPVSEDISDRVICLPIYPGMDKSTARDICEIINQ